MCIINIMQYNNCLIDIRNYYLFYSDEGFTFIFNENN